MRLFGSTAGFSWPWTLTFWRPVLISAGSSRSLVCWEFFASISHQQTSLSHAEEKSRPKQPRSINPVVLCLVRSHYLKSLIFNAVETACGFHGSFGSRTAPDVATFKVTRPHRCEMPLFHLLRDYYAIRHSLDMGLVKLFVARPRLYCLWRRRDASPDCKPMLAACLL